MVDISLYSKMVRHVNPPMIKPFRIAYLGKGGGGGGRGVVATLPSLNLNHCLSDLLLIVVL